MYSIADQARIVQGSGILRNARVIIKNEKSMSKACLAKRQTRPEFRLLPYRIAAPIYLCACLGACSGSDGQKAADGVMHSISVGATHTCAITSDSGAKCWGYNDHGKIGAGSEFQYLVPAQVLGLESADAITAGWSHTCALTSGGAVMCWGANSNGQIGDGSNRDMQETPKLALGLSSGVTAISAGGAHTCVITSSGGVKCWGNNLHGQVGDNTRTDKSTPTPVEGLDSGVVAISAGGAHTCVLTSAGGVKCWGSNDRFQLGDGSSEAVRTVPTQVIGLEKGVVAVSSGNGRTCAVMDNGDAMCWGCVLYETVDAGELDCEAVPTPVTGLEAGVTGISVGFAHACAITTIGEILCWGSNTVGQLGDGTTTERTIPTHVVRLQTGAVEVSAGAAATCAITSNGEAWCWGDGGFGALGNGQWGVSLTPVRVGETQ